MAAILVSAEMLVNETILELRRRIVGDEKKLPYPNHPLLYATHQQSIASGKVNARLHQMGSVKSMIKPRTINSIQKIFFSTEKPYH